MTQRWQPLEDVGLNEDIGWRDLWHSLAIGVALVIGVLALDFLLLPAVYAHLNPVVPSAPTAIHVVAAAPGLDAAPGHRPAAGDPAAR